MFGDGDPDVVSEKAMISKSVLVVLMISDPYKNLMILPSTPGPLHLVILEELLISKSLQKLSRPSMVIFLDVEELLILESWTCGSYNDRWTFL
jgi:hypothetical protein